METHARRTVFEPYAEMGPRHYSLRAILVIALGWLSAAVLAAVFASTSWMLLPLMPVFVLGPVFIVAWAHDYAHTVSPPKPSAHRPSTPTAIGSPYTDNDAP